MMLFCIFLLVLWNTGALTSTTIFLDLFIKAKNIKQINKTEEKPIKICLFLGESIPSTNPFPELISIFSSDTCTSSFFSS